MTLVRSCTPSRKVPSSGFGWRNEVRALLIEASTVSHACLSSARKAQALVAAVARMPAALTTPSTDTVSMVLIDIELVTPGYDEKD